MGNIIEIKHLTKKIENQLILSDINLCFEEEHIYGIVGRNGSGKTVLLKCICGLMEATQGEVIFNGKRLKKDMAYVVAYRKGGETKKRKATDNGGSNNQNGAEK